MPSRTREVRQHDNLTIGSPWNTLSYMYSGHALIGDRRDNPRVRVEMFLNQYIRDLPYRALAMNLSPTGVLVQKLVERTVPRSRTVGLEFELPGTGEIVWARAEPRFDALGDDFHLSGLTFTGIAVRHQRLIQEYVREKRLASRPLTLRRWLRA